VRLLEQPTGHDLSSPPADPDFQQKQRAAMTTPGFNQQFVNDAPDLIAILNKAYAEAYAENINRMVNAGLPAPAPLPTIAGSTNHYPAAYVTAAAPSPSPPPQQTQQQRPSCCCRGCSERLRIVLCCLSLLFDVLTNIYLYFGGLMLPSSISGNDDDDDDNINNSTNIDNNNGNETIANSDFAGTSDPFEVGDTTTSTTTNDGGTSSISIVFLVTAAVSLFFLYVELQLACRAFRENVADGASDNFYFALSAKYVSVLMLLITEGLDSLIAIVYLYNDCAQNSYILMFKLVKNAIHLLIESWEILLDPFYRKQLFSCVGYVIVYCAFLWFMVGGFWSGYFGDICLLLG
jgi:hypothetical protein